MEKKPFNPFLQRDWRRLAHRTSSSRPAPSPASTIIGIIIVIAILYHLFGCTPAPPAQTPTPSNTPTITHTHTPSCTPTPSQTPTVTQTLTPTLRPTKTPDPERIEHAYKIALLVNTNAEVLHQIATKAQDGEMSGIEVWGFMMILSSYGEAVHEEIYKTTLLPSVLRPHWGDFQAAHEATMRNLANWYNKEIGTAQVIENMEPVLESVEEAFQNMETDLSDIVGVSPAKMATYREEFMASIDIDIHTVTPTPSTTP